MRDPEEVLHEKELDLARLRHQVEALRMVAPMLGEEPGTLGTYPDSRQEPTQKNRWPLEVS